LGAYVCWQCACVNGIVRISYGVLKLASALKQQLAALSMVDLHL